MLESPDRFTQILECTRKRSKVEYELFNNYLIIIYEVSHPPDKTSVMTRLKVISRLKQSFIIQGKHQQECRSALTWMHRKVPYRIVGEKLPARGARRMSYYNWIIKYSGHWKSVNWINHFEARRCFVIYCNEISIFVASRAIHSGFNNTIFINLWFPPQRSSRLNHC
jgi:hypothetical protein